MDRVVVALLVLNAIILGVCIHHDSTHENVCVNEVEVADILAVRYRSADILLTNGHVIEVNQATLKPGDPYCVKWEERRIQK